MSDYTYGSPEGIQALKDALLSSPGEGHLFQFGWSERHELADALETASFGGKPWFEGYFGLPVEHSALWPEYLAQLDLGDDDAMALIDSLALAYELGDEFAGQWLAGLCECVDDVEWI
jgi:hypothetical protein